VEESARYCEPLAHAARKRANQASSARSKAASFKSTLHAHSDAVEAIELREQPKVFRCG
jgi:hypothetical protein